MAYSLTTWLAVLSFLWLLSKVARKPRHPPYPPSPKTPWPIIGNALHVPRLRPWLTYRTWGKENDNKIFHLEALGQHIIVLNDIDDAIELMEKRSSLYSDRPHMPLLSLMGMDINAGLLPYGDVWRQHRKVYQQGFRKEIVGSYHPIINEKCTKFLQRMMAQPEGLKEHSEFYTASIILSIVYGHEFDSSDDPILVTTKRAIELSSPEFVSGSLLINSFPVLLNIPKWLPGGGFHDVAAESRKALHDMVEMPYEVVMSRMQSGDNKPSLLQDLLEKQRAKGTYDISVLKNVAGIAFAAGVETTETTLESLFLALAMYPEVQKKARAEILRVIGTTRLPAFEDRPALPYIEALCREVHRWRPAVPAGVPHATTHDDIYQGYFIPKGSLIFFNTWGMTQNQDIYPEPEVFKPERFLDADGSLNDDDRHVVFGFGRRLCPGRHLAIDVIWLTAARIIAAFELSNPRDPVTGQSIDLDVHQYTGDLFSHPPRYVCTIKPTGVAALLRSDVI
ncbi:cytochrome P450 [Pluteus cervinus]|uniref:Cytochrome P450 n=1 Tax=Pluteus cervinus TaxID=181527 RepID=A0ACD3B5I9_9AGAR|nr:cytochrome P450 [Pluteus cervinus]